MNSHLSPSIVCYNGSFQEAANLLNALDCRRVHIDVTAGYSIHGLFRYEAFEVEDRINFSMQVDLHIFDFRRHWNYRNLPLRKNDCAILHLFPWVDRRKIEKALEQGLSDGIKFGLSLDLHTPLTTVLPLFSLVDTFVVMGIEIGGRSLSLNQKAVDDLVQARNLALVANRDIRLGIDGGLNAKTFVQLAKVADTLVVGGLLFNSPDIPAQWAELNRWLKEGNNE